MEYRLTREDVKALRKAKSIVVRVGCDEYNRKAPEALVQITTQKETDKLKEQRHSIACEGKPGGYLSREHEDDAAVFVSLMFYGAWQALAALVRPGDRLRFKAVENGNGYVKAASIDCSKLDQPESHPASYPSLHVDQLRVSVFRPKKSGRDTLLVDDMLLEQDICPDNLARPWITPKPQTA